MALYELHDDVGNIFRFTEQTTDTTVRWSAGEVVPKVVEIPEDLVARYRRVMPEFDEVQQKLQRLYTEGRPSNAVRPK